MTNYTVEITTITDADVKTFDAIKARATSFDAECDNVSFTVADNDGQYINDLLDSSPCVIKYTSEEVMKYKVTDREDADRENPVIDKFDSLDKAKAFAEEWSKDNGYCTVEDENGATVLSVGATDVF